MNALPKARTYNQNHIARKYTPGKRRLSSYWTWSYAFEAQRNPADLDNRFSTMTEVRKVLWPVYEKPEWGAAQFPQGIAGTLELFHRSTLDFQRLAGANLLSMRPKVSMSTLGELVAPTLKDPRQAQAFANLLTAYSGDPNTLWAEVEKSFGDVGVVGTKVLLPNGQSSPQ